MPVIPINEWVPDSAALGNPGAIDIRNAYPGLNSYKPARSLASITGALDARPRGAIEAADKADNRYQYAGDAGKLYQLDGTTWTDVSLGGGYSTSAAERWEFVRWKQQIIATNYDDDPQQITFGGANFADLTTALRFRHVAVIRDFVVAGNTFDGTDGAVPDRVRWSAFDDATDWTVSPVTQSSFRDLKKGGAIQRIIGGDFGLIIAESNTWRMSYVGSPTVFVLDEIGPGIGTLAPGASTVLGDTTYVWSEHGFVGIRRGGVPQFIGEGRVDSYVRQDLDEDYLDRISAVSDPQSGRVMFAYPGAGNTGGRCNRVVVFDTILNKWSILDQELELIWRSGGVAATLESLDDINLGADLVTNGDFAADSDWTKGTGWTISGGTATHAAGTASDLTQIITLTELTYYRLGFDVSGRTAGSVTPVLGGTLGTAISADATGIKESIRSAAIIGAFSNEIRFVATSDFDGSIDNVTMQEIDDIDSMSTSLDDPQWKGGSPVLSAFDANFQNGNFTGAPMTATLETRETEINSGNRTLLDAFYPLVDGGTVTAQVGYRNRQTDAVTWGPTLAQRDTGRFTTRSNATFHRFRLTVSGEWNDAIGVRVEKPGARTAGRRG